MAEADERTKNLKFYATQPHNCSYLEDRQAITLFMDPDKDLDPALYRDLADIGFRRSGQHVYKPQCLGCNACIPARVVANLFEPKRKHKKLFRKNQDIVVTRSEAEYDDETYQLYKNTSPYSTVMATCIPLNGTVPIFSGRLP